MSRPFGVALLMAGYDDRGAQVIKWSARQAFLEGPAGSDDATYHGIFLVLIYHCFLPCFFS